MTTANKTEEVTEPWEGPLLDKIIQVRLDSETYNRLVKKCKRKGTRVSILARHVLQHHLDPDKYEL